MSIKSRASRVLLTAVLGSAVTLGGFSTAGVAAPFSVAAPKQVAESDIVEVQTRPHVRRAQRGVRPGVVHRRRGNDAAVAAAIGIGVLGIAAAAAAAQPRGSYYVDNRHVPVDAWGNPVYGHHYQPVQGSYYYHQQPGYYVEQPRRLSRWERDQIKAQNRAERRQREWEQQQYWHQQQAWQQQQWRQRPRVDDSVRWTTDSEGRIIYGQRPSQQRQLRWLN